MSWSWSCKSVASEIEHPLVSPHQEVAKCNADDEEPSLRVNRVPIGHVDVERSIISAIVRNNEQLVTKKELTESEAPSATAGNQTPSWLTPSLLLHQSVSVSM